MGWITIAVIVIFVILLVCGNLYERLQSLEWRFWRASGLAARESSPTLGSLPVAATYKPTDGLRCGACGYSVRGATGLTCSECGADYRVVGMKPGDSAKSWGAIPIAIVWGIAVMIIANPINNVIEGALYVHKQTITSRREYVAASKAFALDIAVDVNESQYGRNRFQPTGKYSDESLITMTLTGSMGQAMTLLLHPGNGGYEMVEPDGKHVTSAGWPSKETIDGYLESIGVDLADPVHAGEAQTVLNVVSRYQPGFITDISDIAAYDLGIGSVSGIERTPYEFFPSGPFSHSRKSIGIGTPPWVIIGLRLFWLTLWILGIFFAQRKLQRR